MALLSILKDIVALLKCYKVKHSFARIYTRQANRITNIARYGETFCLRFHGMIDTHTFKAVYVFKLYIIVV